jgi:hypothetical protein
MTDRETVVSDVFQNGVKVGQLTEEIILSPETIDKRQIKQSFKTARQELITATQAVQAASTAAAMIPAIKSYTTAANQAFNALVEAMKYVDGELSGMDE